VALGLALGVIAGCASGGTPDSGSRPDSGPIDSGAIDSGAIDSGAIDSGTIDSGTIDSGTIDGGTVDGGGDAGQPRVPPTATYQSSGGGTASSAGHRLRFSIGAPQPAGGSSGAAHRVVIGAGAAGR
jgi:hypothetical protein